MVWVYIKTFLGTKKNLTTLTFFEVLKCQYIRIQEPIYGVPPHHQYFRKLLTSILYMRRMPFQYFLKCNETLLLNSTYFSNMDLLSTIFRTCSFFSTLLYDKNHQILNMIPKKQDRKYTKTTFDS